MFLRLLTISILLFSMLQALHAEYELNGEISHDSRVFIDEGIHARVNEAGEKDDQKGEFNKSISRLELKLQRYDEEGFSMFCKIWATYDHLDSFYNQTHEETASSEETDIRRLEYDEFMLREAHVSANYGPFQIKAGQMILNWGRTDEINPIDVVNPEDISEFYTIEKMDRKIPVLLFNGLLYMGDFTLQAVWIPFFEPMIIPSRGPWAQKMFLDFRKASPETFEELDFNDRDGAGDRNINHSETAVRLNGFLQSFDFGLVFFYGYNDQPSVFMDPASMTMDITYKRFHGYGFDFAYSIGGYGFRGEFFYRDRILYPYQPSPFALDNYESPDIQSIAGVDKTFFDNLYINIQVMYNRVLDYKDDMIMDEEQIMGMGAVEDKFFRETLTIALDFYYGFKEEDWMLGPRIEYALTDNLKAKASGFIVDGPEDSDLGQFAKNDMVTLQINYNF